MIMLGVIVFVLLGTLVTAFCIGVYTIARLGLSDAYALPVTFSIWLAWAGLLVTLGRSWLLS